MRSPAVTFSTIRESEWVALLVLLAAMHVYVWSAAFPFFNNVDEIAHFDLVLKYSEGSLPKGMEYNAEKTVRYVALYGSLFYLDSKTNRMDFLPAPWTLPPEQQDKFVRAVAPELHEINHESSQPPLYYSLAGGWWRLGGWLGFAGGRQLYWLHFLNIPVVMSLVWLGWLAARQVFSEDKFLRLSVPTLLAFFPQSAFYAIQNDVLSPVCFGAAFVCLLRFLAADVPSIRLGVATGLTLAATYLVKSSNLPLLAVSVVVLAWGGIRSWRRGNLRSAWSALAMIITSAVLPVLFWMMWCEQYFGSLTGAKLKVLLLGWTVKPVSEWWHHPIFTPSGGWTFLSELLPRFWQGELTRHRQVLALPAANYFYVAMTLGMLAVAVSRLLIRPQRDSAASSVQQRWALWLSLVFFASAVAFLGFLSIIYDFHQCFAPSPAHPYFTSGRLLLGALIPFALIFVFGFDGVAGWLKLTIRAKYLWFGALLLALWAIELVTDCSAFANVYNWYHM